MNGGFVALVRILTLKWEQANPEFDMLVRTNRSMIEFVTSCQLFSEDGAWKGFIWLSPWAHWHFIYC